MSDAKTPKDPQPPPSPAADERQKRLEAALRANLRRRKAGKAAKPD